MHFFKSFTWFVSLVCAVGGYAESAPGSTPETTQEMDNLLAFAKSPPEALHSKAPMVERMRAMDQWAREQETRADAFMAAHPNDPLRWQAAVIWLNTLPNFIIKVGANFEQMGLKDAVVDTAAKEVWKKHRLELIAAVLAAPDVPAELKEQTAWGSFAYDFREAAGRSFSGEQVDFSPFRARFEQHLETYAQSDKLGARAKDYLGALERAEAGAAALEWQHLATSNNESLRQAATAALDYEALIARPLELAFTAVDGRAVNLEKLRGKVVLVDFWATWCVPCIAELPNVKKVYAEYHDKGFEVVGISFENARLDPKDSPEAREQKLTKAKKVLTDFVDKQEMAWPQYFDGKFWKNDFGQKYSVNSIPAMFLVDRNGMIISTNARGEKLKSEVKRLLTP